MSIGCRVHFNIGDTVKLSRDRMGIIKYVGSVQNKYGEWYGIELNTTNGGKNNGSLDGIFYFQTKDNDKNGIFIRQHQILYLIKRNQNHKTKIIKKKSSKIKKRNYIKNMKQKMTLNQLNVRKIDKDCNHSLIMFIPKDVLKYNVSSYFHSFEKFKLRMISKDFHDIFKKTQNILLSNIESDIKYWTNHTFSKYYKVSPNYFSHLDLRHNRLSYLSKEEQIALKYFVIYNRNIQNLLAQNNDNYQSKDNENIHNDDNDDNDDKKKKNILMTRSENVIEMTRISFCNSSTHNTHKNVLWISDILQYYTSPRIININCLKILDLNYIGLTDEHLLKLCNALLSRKTALNELEYLLLLNNINITDKYIDILFKAIEKSCNNLLHLNFRRCNLSDLSCSIISNFYLNRTNVFLCRHIDIELNTKISKIGTDKINKIFQIKNKKLIKDLIIHYGANKKSYCWECRTLYDQ